ncbi:C1 family peptidase [Streptomyces orinoci]|uniref:C1 family peptidase n=1 Tax=Streptomyces orinoci TaxID=67339 RepID=A0ABV3JXP7_STRON|nr:C1 family peptidase [Streptomyces orinoci]
MSRARHKLKTLSVKARAAIGLSTAVAIGAVTVGVSYASTSGHSHQKPAADQSPHAASGKSHPFGLGAMPVQPQKSLPSASVEPKLAAMAPQPTAGAGKSKKGRAALPASVDLSKYAPAPGNQGQVNSCVAWAIDYSSYSILEHEQKISGGPQAPMYTYSQVVKGRNVGTSPEQHFRIATSQGVDSRKDYKQGDFDYTAQPTRNEIRNAANWKLTGYTPLHTGSQIKTDVQSALAKGEPVVLLVPVYNDFFYLSPKQASSYTYYPDTGTGYVGGHAMTIVGYNSQGVRVENSWGKNWGDRGYINLSWKYLADQAWGADAVGKLVRR